MKLKPFFTYFGGKYRAAPKYPEPYYETIVEPFAGAAGYSVRYPDRQIRLYDLDEKICGLWAYLIAANSDEIMKLPSEIPFEGVEHLDVCQEAKWLIGFWLNKGAASPCKTPSAWMREGLRPNSFWGPVIRQRIADQVKYISHWKIEQKDYRLIETPEATYFVDPPYQKAGKSYVHGSRGFDFPALANWSAAAPGQVIVCENAGADWMDFPFSLNIKANESKSGGKVSKEIYSHTLHGSTESAEMVRWP